MGETAISLTHLFSRGLIWPPGEKKQRILSPSSEAAWCILPPLLMVSWRELQLGSTETARRRGLAGAGEEKRERKKKKTTHKKKPTLWRQFC